MNRDRPPELALLAQRVEAERDAARRIIRDLAPALSASALRPLREEWITASPCSSATGSRQSRT